MGTTTIPTALAPSDEWLAKPKPAGPCVLVIFGITGDLTRRLLFPSLYHLAVTGLLPKEFAVVGFAIDDLSEDAVREHLGSALRDAAGDGADGDIDRVAARAGALHPFGFRRRRGVRAAGWPAEVARPGVGHGRQLSLLHGDRAGFLPPDRPAIGARRTAARSPGPMAQAGDREALRARSGFGARAQPAAHARWPTNRRSTASTITWARRPCRTSWCSASPTASSSRSGTGATWTTCGSRWPRPWAWSSADATTTTPARCATCSRTTCCRF